MWTVIGAALVVFALVSPSAGAQTFTQPTSGQTVLKPEMDYATAVWQDAWDMDKRTDIGWMTWGVDQLAGNMTSKTMVDCTSGVTGCSGFRFTPNGPMANVFLLDTWQPGSAPVNKVGKARPIDTTKYKYLLIKMKVQTGVSSADYAKAQSQPQAQIYWSRDTIYNTSTHPNGGAVLSLTDVNNPPGTYNNPGVVLDVDGVESSQWQIYSFRLDGIHWSNISVHPTPPPYIDDGPLWGQASNTADSLWLSLPNAPFFASTFGNIDIAWARLTATAQTNQTIAWNGGGTYDIVVSPNASCSGYTVLAENKTTGFQFDFGALPPGDYHVGLRPSVADVPGAIQSVSACSSGYYTVPDTASFAFTTPTDTGSSDDFATTYFNNAWDFDSLTDADQIHDMSGVAGQPVIDTAFPAQRPSGTPLGNIRVMKGTSPTLSDPYAYMLWFHGRGQSNRIDPDRYRIFTMDMGLDASRSVNGGSIARVIWHSAGDYSNGGTRALENVGEDLALRHLKFGTETSTYILDRLQVDMKNRGGYPVETADDPPAPSEASPSRSGWTSLCVSPYCTSAPSNPGIDAFRIDFHEFFHASDPPTMAYISQVKLAALEQTGGTYAISWSVTVPSGYTSPTLKLYASRQTVTTRTFFPSWLANQPADGVMLTPSSTCDPGDATLVLITTVSSLTSGTGTYSWNVAGTGGLSNGEEVYICGVVQGTLQGTTFNLAQVMTQFPITINTAYAVKPRLHWDKATLRFSGQRGAGAVMATKTEDQTVSITQVGAGTANWRVESVLETSGNAASYITVTPASGTGTGLMTVSLSGPGMSILPLCTAQDGLVVVIKLVTDGTTQNEPQYIRVYVTIRPQTTTAGCAAPGTIPFGAFDTPTDNATGVVGAIPVTGWALDDVGVSRVMLWRNCVEAIDRGLGACVSMVPGGPGNFVYIGDGAFLAGARPDVENAFLGSPEAYRAGWGYLMLTNALPHLTRGTTAGGQGQFTLYAVALDAEGHYFQLGSKAITLDNDHATVPFGAIDTPTQGGTVPGASAPFDNANAYPNWGWAMTQSGKCIAASDANSYRVYIDGVSRTLTPGTNWVSALDRPDLGAAYPGLCNSHNALAVYYINATALGLSSGLHTIGWDIYDDNGTGTPGVYANIAGIGSRFFNLLVGPSGAGAQAWLGSPAGRMLGYPAQLLDVDRMADGAVVSTAHQQAGEPGETLVQVNGRATMVANEIERIQLDLPKNAGSSPWEGYMVTGGALGLLPLGSSLDVNNGTFFWQPVAGYVGQYDFLFVRRGHDGQEEKLPVRVTYRPKFSPPTFDLARATDMLQTTVARPFQGRR